MGDKDDKLDALVDALFDQHGPAIDALLGRVLRIREVVQSGTNGPGPNGGWPAEELSVHWPESAAEGSRFEQAAIEFPPATSVQRRRDLLAAIFTRFAHDVACLILSDRDAVRAIMTGGDVPGVATGNRDVSDAKRGGTHIRLGGRRIDLSSKGSMAELTRDLEALSEKIQTVNDADELDELKGVVRWFVGRTRVGGERVIVFREDDPRSAESLAMSPIWIVQGVDREIAAQGVTVLGAIEAIDRTFLMDAQLRAEEWSKGGNFAYAPAPPPIVETLWEHASDLPSRMDLRRAEFLAKKRARHAWEVGPPVPCRAAVLAPERRNRENVLGLPKGSLDVLDEDFRMLAVSRAAGELLDAGEHVGVPRAAFNERLQDRPSHLPSAHEAEALVPYGLLQILSFVQARAAERMRATADRLQDPAPRMVHRTGPEGRAACHASSGLGFPREWPGGTVWVASTDYDGVPYDLREGDTPCSACFCAAEIAYGDDVTGGLPPPPVRRCMQPKGACALHAATGDHGTGSR